MADAFNEREKGFEAKYTLDEENKFKIEARRNKLVGEWLAFQFGLTGDAATSYAKDVVVSDLEEPGIEDVMRKVMADIAERGSEVTEDQVRAKMSELHGVAAEQIKSGED